MKKLLLAILVLCVFRVAAQPSLTAMKLKVDQQGALQPTGSEMKLVNSTQASFLFKDKSLVKQADALQWITSQLQLRQGIDLLKETGRNVITNDLTVNKVQQYYKGIKVEHGIINSTSIEGSLAMVQMEFYSIPDKFTTTPVLTEEAALAKAIASVNAVYYAWTGYTGNNPDFMKPRGELVIIQTYKKEGEVCLAYKFNIYAKYPLSRANVYVNALDGTIVLNDPVIKHAGEVNENGHENKISLNQPAPLAPNINLDEPILNANGMADTKYNGRKAIMTDNTGNGTKPYRLRELRNNQRIITLNYQLNPANTVTDFDALAIDFTDNDNNWTSAEFNNTAMDDAAFDAHHSMQYVSDYWLDKHSRNGWDNANGKLVNYVHIADNVYDNSGTYLYTNTQYLNAYWNGTNMHFGDGNGATRLPYTTLDITAHEMGHAITETTSGLVYRWESGALNEGFSDIWAACITRYAVSQDPTITGELTWRMGEKMAINAPPKVNGIRDMQNPSLFEDPSSYDDLHWEPSTYTTCPNPDSDVNDECGVHTNSGVLNKWFFLITQGEKGTNYFGTAYDIKGISFEKSEKIAYLMELNLTPNASFSTAMAVSINAAAGLYGYGSTEMQTVKDAWRAVAVDSSIYNMSNTPVFTTNNFTAIAVGKDGEIWAGSNYSGLYRYDGIDWEKMTQLLDVRINDIKADRFGGIWIAQSGRLGTQGGGSSIAGGVNYYQTSTSATSTLYTVDPQAHVPSRNARCLFIDTTRTNDGANPKVWVATLAYITSNNSTSGMLGQGFYSAYKEFIPISQGINIASGTVGCLTVGGNQSEIWTFVQANNGINQLLTYDAGTNQLIRTYDHNSDPELPSGFVARAIYVDRKKRVWVGLSTGVVMVLDEHRVLHTVPHTLPAGAAVNFNAIMGDKYGDVYIGTSAGILFFDHGIGETNRLDKPECYKLYGKANGLPSDNINAMAYDYNNFKLWVATDSGIIAWEPLCIGKSCDIRNRSFNSYSESKGDGNWSNPAIWSTGMLPDSTTNVFIQNVITVDINATCNSVSLVTPGSLQVNTGKKITIYEDAKPVITGEAVKRRKLR